MNKDYILLENLYMLLESGYTFEETLELCYEIFHDDKIKQMKNQLQDGTHVENILLDADLPHMFKEYFYFFQKKNCLSLAIKKSLQICIQKEDFIKKIKKQLTYPTILIVFLFLFSLFVIFILLPQIHQLFLSFEIQSMSKLIYVYYTIPILCIFIFTFLFALLSTLFYALKNKKIKLIEMFFKVPVLKYLLKKYFSLKFAIYYYEYIQEELDNVKILALLNEQMKDTDLKIVLYEMNNRIQEGESLEMILIDFDYLDSLFSSFFRMYIKNPANSKALSQYIECTFQQLDYLISNIMKYLIPGIYCFVGFFVISIYISIIIPMMNIFSKI